MGPYYKKKPLGLIFNLMELIPAHPCSKSLSFSIFWSTVPSQLPTMKQQCLRIGDEDKISKLPEALLVQILSLLPTEQVIATSVVSTYWKSLWKMVPNLKFISYYHKSRYHTFSEIVTTCLLSHQAPVLESLHLVARDTSDSSDIDMWIGIAFARRVRNLVLDLHYVERKLIRFPNVLCSLNNTLETLELRYSILLHLPSPVCLKSLRKLHLHFVEFKDQESVCNFLCGCPCLEDLVVYRKRNMDVPTFTIAVPSLQRLTIEDNFPGKSDGGYVINAPSLKFLSIQGFADLKFCLIENAPKLVEANIIDVSDITNENILASLTSVKRLSLYVSPLQIKYPTESMFYQLVYLELRNSWNQPWWNLLALMLDRSPKLQILKLIDPRPYLCAKRYHMVDLKWKQPKCVPECLLFHLETFVWTRYEWQREEEKEVATYILKNARRLKKAIFSTEHLHSNELEKLRKKSEMLNELASVVRASSSCHLVFES